MLFRAFLLGSLVKLALSGWGTPLEDTAKISAEERDQMSKDAATASQRDFAPTKDKVAQFLASVAHAKACPRCSSKDYSDPCPLGWAESTDGSCTAPESYGGRCSRSQIFVGSSAAAKMENEIECEICWPCAKAGEDKAASCDRDWAMACPNGYAPEDIAYNNFREASGMTCAVDLSYEGECEPQVSFKDLKAKQDFAERCQTSWPCRQTCAGAFAPCPNDWESIGDGLCTAPDWYKVDDCPLMQNFRAWTRSMKSDFAQKCAITWSCVEAAEAKDGPYVGDEVVAEPTAVPRSTAQVDTEHVGPIDASGNIVGI